MLQSPFSIQSFEAKRVQFESTRSFDEVLLDFQKLVGTTIDLTDVLQGFSEKVHNREDYEKFIQSQLGESGFMPFFRLDHSNWLNLFGIQRKVVRLILGNPLIAFTMMRHDVTAGLFVPVELLLVENESKEGSTVIYNLPSSLMKIEQNPAMLEAAQNLDLKLQILVSRITGVELSKRKTASKV